MDTDRVDSSDTIYRMHLVLFPGGGVGVILGLKWVRMCDRKIEYKGVCFAQETSVQTF
jgi:hypothetical protein